jgi:hypothetical protein
MDMLRMRIGKTEREKKKQFADDREAFALINH